jgi:hypothetical protein
MNGLPPEVVNIIYEFDGRYAVMRRDVITELNTKIFWNELISGTLVGSYICSPHELVDVRPFYRFFFDRFGRIS